MKPFYELLGAPRPFDPTNRFTTSWLLPPLALACGRLLLSLYAFITIFVIFGYDDSHHQSILVRHFFSYFTDLGYFGLAFYFLFSGLHTLSYARSARPWLHSWPRPLQAMHSLFYSSAVTYPILITAVFWAILYDGHGFPNVFNRWSNTSEHALNTVFAAFEILFTRTSPPPALHLLLLMIILALYLALAYITYASEGFYPYDFLNTGKGSGKVAAYAFGILAAIIVIFGIVWGVIWLRRWVTEKKLGMGGKHSEARSGQYEPEMETIT